MTSLGGRVTVPNQFVKLGFSGLFYTTISFPDEQTRDEYRIKAPCLLKDPGWMLLEVRDDGTGVLVRRDGHAIVEAFTKRPVTP